MERKRKEGQGMGDAKKVVPLHTPKSELDEQFVTLEAQRQIIRNQAKEILMRNPSAGK